MSPRRFKNLGKSARKQMVGMGVLLTVIVILGALGLAWGVLERHAFFLPGLQQSRCRVNLETLSKAKAAYQADYQTADGTPVTAEQLVDYLPAGRHSLRCPGGGTYSLNPIGTPPTCSLPRHSHGR